MLKNNISIFRLLSVCMVLISSVAYAGLANKADSAYNKENYGEAVNLYLQSIDEDGVSSEIYYNLGNAYYRDNRLGKAIICYERSLALDPSNSDARTNLDFVKTRILDAPEDDSSFLGNLHKSVKSIMSPDAWAWLSFILFILFLMTIALYLFSSNVSLRKVGFFGGGLMLLIFIYTFVIAYQTSHAFYKHNEAVVIVPTTNLMSAPRATGKNEKVVPIHEGTKVEILDSVSTPDDINVGKWYHVKINNSSRAWLNADDVEKI